jgi:hypothetical protein
MLTHQIFILLDARAVQKGEWACNELQNRRGSWSRTTSGGQWSLFLNDSIDGVILLSAWSQSTCRNFGRWCLLLERGTQACQQALSEISVHSWGKVLPTQAHGCRRAQAKAKACRVCAGLIRVMWALAHRNGKTSSGLWKLLQLDVSDCFGFIPQGFRDTLR